MKNFIITLLFIISIATIPSCSSDISEDNKYGSIDGSVSDATTGEPVPTVRVKLTPGGNSTVTGTDGSFSFLNLEPGEYALDISKEDYKANNAKVNVRAGNSTLAHLLIERIPSIVTADRETLDFGANPSLNTLSFNIVNSSYEDLEWEIEERCDWITEIKPKSGILKYGKTEGIVVVIDRENLSQGKNKAVIVIRSSNGSSQMNVIADGTELPSLNILDATDVTMSSATLNGIITSKGIPSYTERGFVYSQESMPTLENTIKKLSCALTDQNEFSYNLTELEVDKTYYARAYAINSAGTSYSSNEIMFKTEKSLPSLKISDVTNITPSSATLNGEILSAGSPKYKEIGFVYSKDAQPTLEKTIEKLQCQVNNNKLFSYNITDLTYDQTYYIRAYAINDIGTAYSSNELSFKTIIITPQVNTLDLENIDVSGCTATFRGSILNVGEPAYTERGFVYGTMPEPTINDSKVIAEGSGEIGNFSKYVTNLPKTNYYVRAYATTPAGTTYGEEKIVSTEWIEIPSLGIAVQAKDLGKGDWDTANALCKNSKLGGYTDWRLPTKEELIVICSNKDNIGGFENGSTYWSSTQGDIQSSHYGVFFSMSEDRNGDCHSLTDTYPYNVRAVRTIAK